MTILLLEPMLKESFEYSPDLDDAILALYREGASSTRVAVELGITRGEFDALREKNEVLNRLCAYGENLAEAALEEVALQAAKGEVKNFNATILQFIMKNQYPDRYNDKKSGDTGPGTLLEQLTAGSLKIVRHNE